jgi:hypothetical protein
LDRVTGFMGANLVWLMRSANASLWGPPPQQVSAEESKSFPSGAVEQTAAVFAALASSRIPLDEKSIATQFCKTRNTDKKIGDVLSALARLGHVTTNDGKMFAVGRVA